MADVDRIVALTLEAQERVFRLSARDHGMSLQWISRESNIPYNTIRSYAGHNGEQAMMPIAALNKLCGVIPDDLLSHLTEPGGRILDKPSEDGDHETTVANCLDFVAHKQKAHHPESPAGVEIADCEDRSLRVAKARLA
jgi:hypothetical protein